MSVTAAASGFVVLLLTVTVVQCENGWDVSYTSTEICAVRGSTVDITCTYTYPSTVNNHDTTVQETFWFIKESNGIHVDLRTDPEYSGRVENLCGNNKCTLRISNLRESDSAVYKFMFTTNQPTGSLTGSAGVTLSVTDLHVQVRGSGNYDSNYWAELRCQSSCRLLDHLNYVWYKNQQKMNEGASYSDYFYHTDSVSCAVKGLEDFRSLSMLVWSQIDWSVSYTSTEICAFRGSTVDINCTYTYTSRWNNHYSTVQETFWFIKESNGIHVDLSTDPEYSGRVENLCGNNKCTLRISNLTESDSAVYKFRFTTNQHTGSFTGYTGVTLSVTDPQLQVHVRRSTANPSSTWTELTCHSRCQLPDHLSYVWYNNNKPVERKKYFHLQHFKPEDSYHCAIEGRLHNQSEEYCDRPYASVHFMKSETDPVYSSVGSAEPSEHKEVEEVAYSSVNFNRSAPRTRGQDTGEDPAALYSTSFILCTLFICGRFYSLKSQTRAAATMSVTAAASGFVVLLLTVTVVQGEDDWGVRCTPTQICAVKGSKVQIRCSYWHPSRIDDHDVAVEKEFWFTKVQDSEPVDLRSASEYTGRVKYDCGNKACTLTITDLRDSDLDVYQFRFTTNQPTGSFTGSPGVTLSVTGVQVLTTKLSRCRQGYCSWSHVECQTSCPPTPSLSYIWFKNGQKTSGEQSYTAYFYSADSISCAVRGQEDFPSAPVCVDGNSCNRVNYINRNICAFKGSSVDISCSYSSHSNRITSKSWLVAERKDVQLYRPQAVDLLKDPEFTARVQVLDPEPGRSTLRIMNLRLSDSAQYRFTFKSQWFEWDRSFPGTTLTVTDVQVICSPIGPTLTCHSSCLLSGRPSFVWYKNGREVHGETSPTFRGFLHPENNYSCAYEHHHSSPVYAPKVPLVQLSQPGDILKDSSVSLTCSSDANPPPAYTWYKENQALLNRAAQLVFRSIPLSDSGEYYCTAENELGKTASKRVLINVKYAPQSSSVSVSPSGEIMEGSSVTLTCSSDANPAANYTWYKEDRTLLQGPEGVYLLSSISSGDSGVYSCKSENQYGRINSTSLHLDAVDSPMRRDCFSTTEWCVFQDDNIIRYTDVVICYISKCIDDVIWRITDNNPHLNVSKTKDLSVDYRKRKGVEHAPLAITGTTVERW
ncbi:uncharacterized protein LOC128437537 [Pleuronectes platessa]|uniref:uncharacterized protein LOC128437537 n=1 Tax=Pleuronectes platessa TaxID=8262 RepID=UPI00232A4BAF|nr:uncharacterized protein LOC128437537 [Pleuronectes platessa]